jgi:3-phosphoshikimate 1-carboxyvinyltransferase
LGLGWLEGGRVDSSGDHRIAMAAAVAATAATGPITISGAEAAAVSWPRFYEALEALWSSR